MNTDNTSHLNYPERIHGTWDSFIGPFGKPVEYLSGHYQRMGTGKRNGKTMMQADLIVAELNQSHSDQMIDIMNEDRERDGLMTTDLINATHTITFKNK